MGYASIAHRYIDTTIRIDTSAYAVGPYHGGSVEVSTRVSVESIVHHRSPCEATFFDRDVSRCHRIVNYTDVWLINK